MNIFERMTTPNEIMSAFLRSSLLLLLLVLVPVIPNMAGDISSVGPKKRPCKLDRYRRAISESVSKRVFAELSEKIVADLLANPREMSITRESEISFGDGEFIVYAFKLSRPQDPPLTYTGEVRLVYNPDDLPNEDYVATYSHYKPEYAMNLAFREFAIKF